MSESSIGIQSDLTLERDAFLASLAAARQDVDQFVAYLNGLSANINLGLKTDKAKEEADRFIRELEARDVKLNVSLNFAGGMGGAGIGGGGPSVSNTLNQANFQQNISNQTSNLFQQIDASINQQLSQLFQQYNSTVNNTINNVVNNASGGGGGKGGGGSSRFLGLSTGGLARYVGAGFLLREAFRGVQMAGEYGSASDLANEQPEGMLKAEMGLYKGISGIPVVGQASSLVADSIGHAFGFGTEDIQRQERLASEQDAASKGMAGFRNQGWRAGQQAGMVGMGGEARSQAESQFQYENTVREVNERRAEQAEKFTKQSQDERGAISAPYHGFWRGTKNFIKSGWDYGLAERNDEIEERSKIDAQGAMSAQRTKQSDQEAENQRKIAAARRDAEVALSEGREHFAGQRSAAEIGSIGAEAGEAGLRAAGQGREAGNKEYARRLQEEIDLLKQRAYATRDAAEGQRLLSEAAAREAAAPELIVARSAIQQRQENYADTISSQRIGDIYEEGVEGGMRAGGNTRGAAKHALSRQIDDRVNTLRAQAKNASTPEEARRLNAEAQAEETEKATAMGNLEVANRRETTENIVGIEERAYEDRLKAQGRFLQASESAANAHYDREIKRLRDAGRNEEADDMEQEKSAAAGSRQASRDRSNRAMFERADEMHLRNRGRPNEARMRELSDRIDRELDDATGDPDKQRAIRAQGIEEAKALRHSMASEVATDPRQAYLDVLRHGGMHGDRGMQGLDNVIKNLKGGGQADPNHHPGGNFRGGDVGDKLDKAGDKLAEAAQKIIDAPTLVTADFA